MGRARGLDCASRHGRCGMSCVASASLSRGMRSTRTDKQQVPNSSRDNIMFSPYRALIPHHMSPSQSYVLLFSGPFHIGLQTTGPGLAVIYPYFIYLTVPALCIPCKIKQARYEHTSGPAWLARNYAAPHNINRRRHSLSRCSWQVHLELDDLFPREMRWGVSK